MDIFEKLDCYTCSYCGEDTGHILNMEMDEEIEIECSKCHVTTLMMIEDL